MEAKQRFVVLLNLEKKTVLYSFCPTRRRPIAIVIFVDLVLMKNLRKTSRIYEKNRYSRFYFGRQGPLMTYIHLNYRAYVGFFSGKSVAKKRNTRYFSQDSYFTLLIQHTVKRCKC